MGAITVVRNGVAARGVPQRLLLDNGAALDPSRRGVLGQLVADLRSLGVEPITGKLYKPTTQGKNERFHQTLFRYLEKQPLADTLDQLQAQVDAFDRSTTPPGHTQALPGRITPAQAWNATPLVKPPRRAASQPPLPGRTDDIRVKLVQAGGSVEFRGIKLGIGRALGGHRVCVMDAGKSVLIFDLRGTLIIEHSWPKPGTTYVSNRRPRGPGRRSTRLPEMS